MQNFFCPSNVSFGLIQIPLFLTSLFHAWMIAQYRARGRFLILLHPCMQINAQVSRFKGQKTPTGSIISVDELLPWGFHWKCPGMSGKCQRVLATWPSYQLCGKIRVNDELQPLNFNGLLHPLHLKNVWMTMPRYFHVPVLRWNKSQIWFNDDFQPSIPLIYFNLLRNVRMTQREMSEWHKMTPSSECSVSL